MQDQQHPAPYELNVVVEIDPDERAVTYQTSRVDERDWQVGEPFHDPQEAVAVGMVEVYGDDDAAFLLRNFAKRRSIREEAATNVHPRRLSAEDLRAMRDWDIACCFADREHSCETLGCEAWDDEDGNHDSTCPWNDVCGNELEALGLALHRRDPTFWERLRKLSATPELVTEANAILLPKAPQTQRANPPRLAACAARRRTGTRARGRRAAPARRTSASRGSPDGDDGSGPPPPELRLWRHPRFGSATPNLLRLLVRAQAEEAQR
jgi:hypothetical protein